MSEFREKLEKLLMEIIDNPDMNAPSVEELKIMVEYAKIPPEQPEPEMMNPMTMMYLYEQLKNTLSKEKVDTPYHQIVIDNEILELIDKKNPFLEYDKLVITRDKDGNAIALRVR